MRQNIETYSIEIQIIQLTKNGAIFYLSKILDIIIIIIIA